MVNAHGGHPLRQHEVALLNATKVLGGLLAQPAKPWLHFPDLIAALCQQSTALRERSAACRIQRAVRRRAARRQALAQIRSKPAPLPPSLLGRPLPLPPARPALPQTAGGHAPVASAKPTKQLDAPEPNRSVPAPPFSYAYAAPAPPASGSKALNPIEKRRQMVASQLAACNPSRLPRSRRPMFVPKPTPGATTSSRAASPSTPRGALPELSLSARQSPRSVPLSPVRKAEAGPGTPSGRSRTASPRLASPARSLAPSTRCSGGPAGASFKDDDDDDPSDADGMEGHGAFAAPRMPMMAPPPPLRAA